ncbi:hypothetical protein ACOSQ4_027122 [Xanthoceras sorbifolium]
MSWLINSMMPNSGENFILYETAAEVWEAAKETYSHKDNAPELQQLDAFEKYKWSTAADSQQYKKIIETKRVYKFCLGLNPNLDAVRGRIFGTKPLPSLREAFSEIRREESRRTLMLGAESKEPKEVGGEASALAARNMLEPRKGGRPWCDHCRKPGHQRDSKANLSSSSVAEPFSKEQLEVLQKLLTQGQHSQMVIGSGIVAKKSNFLTALAANQDTSYSWIVDSGASDHMTGFALGEDDW